jgi:hypothetical protein
LTALFDLQRPAVDPLLVNEKVMAVDFGKNGGFVWNEALEGLRYMDMPKKKVDEEWITDREAINRLLGKVKPSILYGENIHTFPGQGVVSSGTFMEEFGVIQGICLAWGIKVELLEPASWVRWYEFGRRGDFRKPNGKLDTTAWKDHLHEHALALFPNSEITKKCADALLIWNYALNPQRIRKIKPFR